MKKLIAFLKVSALIGVCFASNALSIAENFGL